MISKLLYRPVQPLTELDIRDLHGSISDNTAKTYRGHLQRIAEFAGNRQVNDESLRDFIHAQESAGKSPATCAQAIAAAVFWAKANGQPSPAGALTERAMKRIHRCCFSNKNNSQFSD